MRVPVGYKYKENSHLISILSYSGGVIRVSIDLNAYEIKGFRKDTSHYGLKMVSRETGEVHSLMLPPFSSFRCLSRNTLEDMYGPGLDDLQIERLQDLANHGDDEGNPYSPVYVYEDNGKTYVNKYVLQLISNRFQTANKINKPLTIPFQNHDVVVFPSECNTTKIMIKENGYKSHDYVLSTFVRSDNRWGIKTVDNNNKKKYVLFPTHISLNHFYDGDARYLYDRITEEEITVFDKVLLNNDNKESPYSPLSVYEINEKMFICKYFLRLIDNLIEAYDEANSDSIPQIEIQAHRDYLGNVLNVGDYCIRVYGNAYLGLGHITKLNNSTAAFSIWPSRTEYTKIISLTAYGIEGKDSRFVTYGAVGVDDNGKQGDIILYSSIYSSFVYDIASNVSNQKVRFDKDEGRMFKDKENTLNLTALGIDKKIVQDFEKKNK